MDSDTETRRVSPVAVLADGYLDLVNGPEDHGWCSGYTCQKRVSLFSILVVLGNHYSYSSVELFGNEYTRFQTYVLPRIKHVK